MDRFPSARDIHLCYASLFIWVWRNCDVLSGLSPYCWYVHCQLYVSLKQQIHCYSPISIAHLSLLFIQRKRSVLEIEILEWLTQQARHACNCTLFAIEHSKSCFDRKPCASMLGSSENRSQLRASSFGSELPNAIAIEVIYWY